MALDHPVLGVGPGNWPVHYPKYMSPGDPSFDADDAIPTNPWPSSDWMAMLSERGLPASLLLLLVGGSIALAAWARIRRRARRPPELGDLTIVATLIALVVVGAFDAVLLLPAPAFFVWATARRRWCRRRGRSAKLTRRRALKRRMTLSVAIVGGLLLTQSLIAGRRRWRSPAARSGTGWRSRRSWIRAATASTCCWRSSWRAAGRCDKARPHAERGRRALPQPSCSAGDPAGLRPGSLTGPHSAAQRVAYRLRQPFCLALVADASAGRHLLAVLPHQHHVVVRACCPPACRSWW